MKDSIEHLIKNSIPLQDSDIDLSEIEKNHGIRLSSSLRTFFQKITGKKGCETDHVLLYGSDSFEPAAPHIECKEGDKDYTDCYMIADFDDWCWGYCVNVKDLDRMPVYIIGSNVAPLVKIADDISEFIIMCVDTNPKLFIVEK